MQNVSPEKGSARMQSVVVPYTVWEGAQGQALDSGHGGGKKNTVQQQIQNSRLFHQRAYIEHRSWEKSYCLKYV